MTDKGTLLVLTGPSGCGKGTVLQELIKADPSVFLSVSATTRAPRPGEVDGQNYFFLTKQAFETLIEQDGMLEYACYVDNYYGTPRQAVEQKRNEGRNVILEIEVQGALQVKQRCPEAVLVFLLPPSMAELERRLINRQTEDLATVKKRLAMAKDELEQANLYDFIIINDDVEKATRQLSAVLSAASCLSRSMQPQLQAMLKEV